MGAALATMQRLQGQFLRAIWWYHVIVLSRMLLIFYWNIPKHNILDFGGGIQSICSDSLLCGQLFGKSNFLLRLSDRAWQPLSRTRWIFRWNIPNHNILEFGCWMWNICSGSVLCGQLWEMIIKNFLGWFLNILQYPWAQNCGSIIGICQSST